MPLTRGKRKTTVKNQERADDADPHPDDADPRPDDEQRPDDYEQRPDDYEQRPDDDEQRPDDDEQRPDGSFWYYDDEQRREIDTWNQGDPEPHRVRFGTPEQYRNKPEPERVRMDPEHSRPEPSDPEHSRPEPSDPERFRREPSDPERFRNEVLRTFANNNEHIRREPDSHRTLGPPRYRTENGRLQPRPPTEWRQSRVDAVSRIREPESRLSISQQETTETTRRWSPVPTESTGMVTLKYDDLRDLLMTIGQPARATTAASSDLPVFYGYAHEDPRRHLDICEERLRRRPMDLWKEAIAERFKGDAAKWWNDAKMYIGEYNEFQRCFLRHFDDSHTIQQLHYELVNKRQGAKESIEAFASQKRLLARRLTPSMTEPELVDLCLGLARKEVYREFVDRRPNKVDDFIDIASVYERLDRPPAETSSARRQPKCRFCPGFHFHAECPEARRTRPGNANGVIRSAEPNATSTRPRQNDSQ